LAYVKLSLESKSALMTAVNLSSTRRLLINK
jgi:hypothetical protein